MAAWAQHRSVRHSKHIFHDRLLCKFVKRSERVINATQREVDEIAWSLFAQELPMAVDLRFLLGTC